MKTVLSSFAINCHVRFVVAVPIAARRNVPRETEIFNANRVIETVDNIKVAVRRSPHGDIGFQIAVIIRRREHVA